MLATELNLRSKAQTSVRRIINHGASHRREDVCVSLNSDGATQDVEYNFIDTDIENVQRN